MIGLVNFVQNLFFRMFLIVLGELAAFRWRSKFGRPSKVPRLGDVDPTGSYCPVPEDWLLRKYGKCSLVF